MAKKTVQATATTPSNKINSFDRATLRALKDVISAALQPIEQEYGLKITFGSGNFSDTNYTAKLHVDLVNAGTGVVNTQERADWARYAPMYGLEATQLDRIFISRGMQFQVTGFKPNRPKFPVSAKRVADGRGYKFTVNQLRTARWIDQLMKPNKRGPPRYGLLAVMTTYEFWIVFGVFCVALEISLITLQRQDYSPVNYPQTLEIGTANETQSIYSNGNDDSHGSNFYFGSSASTGSDFGKKVSVRSRNGN